ncbi:hypothetical protein H9P43_002313 [Blastocladiella emersonii ATCC 22665]|nr:hypothetical protein H9P43_002313 [Blastocladiella emersonii ATCC 22665]
MKPNAAVLIPRARRYRARRKATKGPPPAYRLRSIIEVVAAGLPFTPRPLPSSPDLLDRTWLRRRASPDPLPPGLAPKPPAPAAPVVIKPAEEFRFVPPVTPAIAVVALAAAAAGSTGGAGLLTTPPTTPPSQTQPADAAKYASCPPPRTSCPPHRVLAADSSPALVFADDDEEQEAADSPPKLVLNLDDASTVPSATNRAARAATPPPPPVLCASAARPPRSVITARVHAWLGTVISATMAAAADAPPAAYSAAALAHLPAMEEDVWSAADLWTDVETDDSIMDDDEGEEEVAADAGRLGRGYRVVLCARCKAHVVMACCAAHDREEDEMDVVDELLA